LREIADIAEIPLLRKDFIVDEYMIYQAKFLGASAVLLICALLDRDTLKKYIDLAHDIGLSALVETHDERETETALDAGARVIGVNNRSLETFEVDMTLSGRLRKLVPPEVLFVAESGVSSPEDIEMLRGIGADAVLIGETVMRASDRRAAIERLRGRA
jgi:indole-3-glycerol phosphate synthase